MERGFLPWEKSALAAVWIAPLLARAVAQGTLIPLGLIAMMGLLALIVRRAMADQTR
jgi:hypothetical protein